MRFVAAAALAGAALSAGVLLVPVARPAPVLAADAADEKVAELKNLEKTDEGKCVAKMEEWKDAGEPKILAVIKDFAEMRGSKKEKVVCAAMKIIVNRPAPKDLDFLKKLIGKIEDKELADRKDGKPAVYKTILESIAVYKADPAAAKQLKSAQAALDKAVIRKYMGHKDDNEYAVAAVAAYAAGPDKFTGGYQL
jgi:hypothetical protein